MLLFVYNYESNLFMKIYFSGSIRGGREHQELYSSIIGELKKYGEVLTEHLGDPNLSVIGSSGPVTEIYSQDMSWLGESDIVIAEVSTPSLGVGYEIAWAEVLKKPTICLYKPEIGKSLSAMIAGSPHIKLYE